MAILPAVLLQFGTIPFWDWSSPAGKQIVFAGLVLVVVPLFLLRGRRLYLPRVLIWATLLVLLLLGSGLLSRSPTTALLPVAVLVVGILYLLAVIRLFRESPDFISKFLDALLFAGGAAGAIGLYQCTGFLLFRDSHHVFIPYLIPPSWGARITGVYGQPNLFALLMALCLLGFFYRYIHTELNFSHGLWKALRFVPVYLVGLSFFLTQSRNGLVALGVTLSLLVYLVLKGRCCRASSERREFLLLMACLGASFATYWILTHVPLFGEEAMVRGVGNRLESDDGRWVFLTSAVLIFLDHPLLGVGLDHYKLFLANYMPHAHDLLGFVEYEAMGYTRWAHNEWLQILCEGGIIAFAIAAGLTALFAWCIWKKILQAREAPEPLFLYSHLFLLPFLLQSMFSWPLRFPGLLALFWVFLAILLVQYPLRRVVLPRGAMWAFGILLLGGWLALAHFANLETKLGSFYAKMRKEDPWQENLAEFERLLYNPYSQSRVMYRLLPSYINQAFFGDDEALAKRLLPLAEVSVQLQGTHWQWYGLGLLYDKVGREEDARIAAEKAIDLQPIDKAAWNLVHHLNILKASRETGRSVESFYPDEEALEFKKITPPELPND